MKSTIRIQPVKYNIHMIISVPRRFLLPAFVFIIVAGGIWAVLEFQPKKQLERRFDKLTSAVERRNWEKVKEFIAADYQDRWGMDRDTGISTASDGLAQFFILNIETEPLKLSIEGGKGMVACKPILSGSGSGVASRIMEKVNSFEQDMTFIWRRESWKPWDWKLVACDHPEIPAGYW